MDSLPQSRLLQSRRDILKPGALAVVPLAILRNLALQDQQPMSTNGGADPYTSKCDFAILGDEVNGRYYDG